MKMTIRHLIVIIILISCPLFLAAQKSAELYIPIGKSPGVSGEHSVLGTVEDIDLQDSTITISTETASTTISIKGRPEVMMDYSHLKQPNEMGSLTDIPEGATVELKYEHNKPDEPVDWIKCKVDY